MAPIKIIFFILASFFAIESEKIAAEKTTVTVSPQNKEVEIVHENLFAFVQSESDSLLVLEEWDKLLHQKDADIAWSELLNNFTTKELNIETGKDIFRSHLKLSYADAEDLETLEIRYDAENNQFSIENSVDYNISTEDGKLMDDHWVFDGDHIFRFTIEPFLEIPEEYHQFKRPLQELL